MTNKTATLTSTFQLVVVQDQQGFCAGWEQVDCMNCVLTLQPSKIRPSKTFMMSSVRIPPSISSPMMSVKTKG